MEEPDVNSQLLKEDLFAQFKAQVKKDFEGAGMSGEFTEQLPSEFDALKSCILTQLQKIRNSSNLLPSLLYRIDISEQQLQRYEQKRGEVPFEEMLAELIVKRVLQKVILKRTFSK